MRALTALLAAAALLAALAGCTTSTNAVAQGGSFEFVSPDGRTDLLYDPPESRGTVGDISGPDLTDPDRTVSLADFAGSVVVLNVWGSWCEPCRRETDDLVRVAERTADDGVRFLGINFRDSQEAGADFARDYGMTYPSIYDPPGRTLFALGDVPRSAVPLTVVLDRQQRVAAVFIRDLLESDLLPVVERVAAEPL